LQSEQGGQVDQILPHPRDVTKRIGVDRLQLILCSRRATLPK
jgi:hypothetical protein